MTQQDQAAHFHGVVSHPHSLFHIIGFSSSSTAELSSLSAPSFNSWRMCLRMFHYRTWAKCWISCLVRINCCWSLMLLDWELKQECLITNEECPRVVSMDISCMGHWNAPGLWAWTYLFIYFLGEFASLEQGISFNLIIGLLFIGISFNLIICLLFLSGS